MTSAAGCPIRARAGGRCWPRWTRACPASVIAASLYERFESRDAGEFTGKILSAMRSEFGGHAEKKA